MQQCCNQNSGTHVAIEKNWACNVNSTYGYSASQSNLNGDAFF